VHIATESMAEQHHVIGGRQADIKQLAKKHAPKEITTMKDLLTSTKVPLPSASNDSMSTRFLV